tara:strand:- start:235 stop:639 length:405 start_codon:yes stop_codon:yes gene_type:complete
MASNAQILKTFGKQVEEFMEDMLVIFPNDNVILRGKMYFEMMKKANPRFIIRVWKNRIAAKYGEHIANDNFDIFVTMDLSEDIIDNPADNKEEVVTHLQNMLNSIIKMDEHNKNKAFKYIQNITKLSEMYQLTN